MDRSLTLRDATEATLEQAGASLDELEVGTRVEEQERAGPELVAAKTQLAPQQGLLADLTITAIRAVVLHDAGLAEIRPDALWLGAFMLGGLLVAALRLKKRLD